MCANPCCAFLHCLYNLKCWSLECLTSPICNFYPRLVLGLELPLKEKARNIELYLDYELMILVVDQLWKTPAIR